jgi:hypothetical protein
MIVDLKKKHYIPLMQPPNTVGEYVDYIGNSFYLSGRTRWGKTVATEDAVGRTVTVFVQKNRYWRHTEDYDIVKTICYMAIHGKIDGCLVEVFPPDSAMTERRTVIKWNEWAKSEWQKIERELEMIALELVSMTDSEIRAYFEAAHLQVIS